MFSTLPQGVREEGWQAWESIRMQREDFDAPTNIHDASDSEMSCISDADSCTTRRRKLDSIYLGGRQSTPRPLGRQKPPETHKGGYAQLPS